MAAMKDESAIQSLVAELWAELRLHREMASRDEACRSLNVNVSLERRVEAFMDDVVTPKTPLIDSDADSDSKVASTTNEASAHARRGPPCVEVSGPGRGPGRVRMPPALMPPAPVYGLAHTEASLVDVGPKGYGRWVC